MPPQGFVLPVRGPQIGEEMARARLGLVKNLGAIEQEIRSERPDLADALKWLAERWDIKDAAKRREAIREDAQHKYAPLIRYLGTYGPNAEADTPGWRSCIRVIEKLMK